MIIKNATINELQVYLVNNDHITANEQIVEVSNAGEGNMNCVLRIQTNKQSFICKQSSAYVEKYPQIAAPQNRVQTEAAFYQKIKNNDNISVMMPEILGVDIENNILFLQDLGAIQDFSSLYDLRIKLTNSEVISLTNYLNQLHRSFKKETSNSELENLELRKLNYEHIFNYPFLEDNGFDLNIAQPGLQEIALPYKNNSILKTAITTIGNSYLENGLYLLHGDFYPGSWFNCKDKIMIIDPEFCYFGHREFDLAVFIAHMYLTKHEDKIIEMIAINYIDYSSLNHKLLNGLVGIEILRRLIGLAQLPLKMALNDKKELLEKAQNLILN